MKKATLEQMLDYLNGATVDTAAIAAEIEQELARGKAKADANRELYAAAKDIVLGVLTDTPVTVAEIYDEVKEKLPEGFGKGKVQYALSHYWEADVVAHDGKTKGYTRKDA